MISLSGGTDPELRSWNSPGLLCVVGLDEETQKARVSSLDEKIPGSLIFGLAFLSIGLAPISKSKPAERYDDLYFQIILVLSNIFYTIIISLPSAHPTTSVQHGK